jgi:hypothetical protein
MAARKPAAAKTAAAKTPAVRKAAAVPVSAADIKKQMAEQMANIKDRIGSISGNKIQIKSDKTFHLPDGDVLNELEVVIIDFTNRNMFYENTYDENNIEAPECYAVGATLKDMIPAKNVTEPQADSCSECPLNAFGSRGKGKACKNSRRLAVLAPDAGPEDQLMTLDVSPTAIKRFDKVVSDIARELNILPIGVVVKVSFNPSTTYASLDFEILAQNENVGLHWLRREEAAELINQEIDLEAFETNNAAAAQTSKRKVAPKRKAPARR